MLYAVLLLLLAAVLLLVELFIIPGSSVAGFAGVVSWLIGLIVAFMHSYTWGIGLSAASLVAFILIFRFISRPKFMHRFALKYSLAKQTTTEKPQITYTGIAWAATSLRPFGRIELPNGEQHEARSLSGFIDSGSAVEVTGSEGKYYLVKKKSQT